MNQRFEHPHVDQEMDRELAALCAVNPSPEFLARVRMRIARTPEPSRWRLSRAFAVAGAAALVLVVAAVWRAERAPSDSGATPLRLARADEPLAAQAVPSGVVSTASSPPPLHARRPHARTGVDGPDETVLVDEAEAKALGRLLAGAREGRVELGPLPEAVPATVALGPVAAIVIPAIQIEPLSQSGEGARP